MAIDVPLDQRLEELSRVIAEDAIQRLREYEALHGKVKPAPRSARITRRSTVPQMMAVVKSTLLQKGWLAKE